MDLHILVVNCTGTEDSKSRMIVEHPDDQTTLEGLSWEI